MNVQLTFYNVKMKRQIRSAGKARIRKSFELIVKTTAEELLRARPRRAVESQIGIERDPMSGDYSAPLAGARATKE